MRAATKDVDVIVFIKHGIDAMQAQERHIRAASPRVRVETVNVHAIENAVGWSSRGVRLASKDIKLSVVVHGRAHAAAGLWHRGQGRVTRAHTPCSAGKIKDLHHIESGRGRVMAAPADSRSACGEKKCGNERCTHTGRLGSQAH